MEDWSYFVKFANPQGVQFGQDGSTFTLGSGKTLSHVVSEWNRLHPDRKITVDRIVAANGMLRPEKYVAGKAYVMPRAKTGVNNPFNMRHYNQKWLGEDSAGIPRGEMLSFKDLFHGVRAGSRNAANLMAKLETPTIRSFVPIYSPDHENDTQTHMGNISRASGIGPDDVIDPNDDAKWIKFLKGLATAESGKGSLKGLSEDQILKAVQSSRVSK